MLQELTGSIRKKQNFEFRPGPVISQVVLADEINRATPRTQSALLEAMQEHQVTVDGTSYKLPRPYLVLATQNPIELEGTFPLPEAQLDRFLIRIKIGYPTESEEDRILLRFGLEDPMDKLSAVNSPEEIILLQQACKEIRVEDHSKYIVAIPGNQAASEMTWCSRVRLSHFPDLTGMGCNSQSQLCIAR